MQASLNYDIQPYYATDSAIVVFQQQNTATNAMDEVTLNSTTDAITPTHTIGPSYDIQMTVLEKDIEWTPQIEKRFDDLIAKEWESGLTKAETHEMEMIVNARRARNPPSLAEVLYEEERSRRHRKLMDALQECVEFDERTNQAR